MCRRPNPSRPFRDMGSGVARGDPAARERILAAMNASRPRQVNLKRPIQVITMYREDIAATLRD